MTYNCCYFQGRNVKERVCGLKNFVSVIDSLGTDIEQIEGFMDYGLKIINFAIHSPFAVEIRQEVFNIKGNDTSSTRIYEFYLAILHSK